MLPWLLGIVCALQYPDLNRPPFKYWARGFNYTALVATSRMRTVGRIAVQSGTLYEYNRTSPPSQPHARLLMFLKVICKACSEPLGMPDVDVLIEKHENCVSSTGNQAPVWSFTKGGHCDSNMFYPYWSFLWRGRTPVPPPWEPRKAMATWRGSPSDNGDPPPRNLLVQKCAKMPQVCDAGFTRSGGLSPSFLKQYPIKSPINHTAEKAYKFQLVLDGCTSASSRSLRILESGSCMFLQLTPRWEFFYQDLQPYVHYIPLTLKVENLEDALNWALKNDKAAETIAQNARTYATDTLSENSVMTWLVANVRAYAKLQRFKVNASHPASLYKKVTFNRHVAAYFHRHITRNLDAYSTNNTVPRCCEDAIRRHIV